MTKSMGKINYGESQPEKVLKLDRHVYLEDIEKAQIAGYMGLVASSIDYRDFLKFKKQPGDFNLEVDRFGES